MKNEEKLQQLQMLEQSLQQLLSQRQQFQGQLLEINSALEELEKTEKAYKIVGNLMVASNKEDLKKELSNKKEIVQLRIKTLEKQENQMKEKAQTMQKEVMENMKKEE